MASINQTIIIRTDLFGPEDIGLLSAQVGHIHFEIMRQFFRNNLIDDEDVINSKLSNSFSNVKLFKEWMEDPYLLIKQVPNKEALIYFIEEATIAGIEVNKWYDTVYVRLSKTQQKAFPNVLVGASFGPDDADKIRTILGDLPLL